MKIGACSHSNQAPVINVDGCNTVKDHDSLEIHNKLLHIFCGKKKGSKFCLSTILHNSISRCLAQLLGIFLFFILNIVLLALQCTFYFRDLTFLKEAY